MPISPALSTGVKGSDATDPTLSTGHAKLEATLTGVTATHGITVETHAFKFATPSGELVTGVTIGGVAADLVVRSAGSATGTNHRTETCIWFLEDLPADDYDIVVSVNGPLHINWHAESWPVATASAVDLFDDAQHFNPDTATVSVPSAGTLGPLDQAVELVIAAFTSKYNWSWNGTYGGGGEPPDGFTLLEGLTEDNVNQCCFQTSYQETTSTAGVSATTTLASSDANTTAAIATFRLTTTQRRVKVFGKAAMNGATGITAHAWPGNPKDHYAEEWLGVSAEASGGIVYLDDPPASWTTGSYVNVILYQPSGAKKGTSWVLGIVEEA